MTGTGNPSPVSPCPISRLKTVAALLCLGASTVSATERICVSPDCLSVGSAQSPAAVVKSIGILDTRLHIYIYVPSEVSHFSLDLFDQQDEVLGSTDSEFQLFSPEGKLIKVLDAPRPGQWSDYTIDTQHRWGIWRLSVTGPEDFHKAAKKPAAKNRFMVRTRGNVDLYLQPEPVARVRGMTLSPPCFGGPAHNFWLDVRDSVETLPFQIWRQATQELIVRDENGGSIHGLQRSILFRDDRLPSGTLFETVKVPRFAGHPNSVSIDHVEHDYRLGTTNGTRLFFNSSRIFPRTREVKLDVKDEGGAPIATRIELTSGHTANESLIARTTLSGVVQLRLLPAVEYRAKISRGQEYFPQIVTINPGTKSLAVSLKRRLPNFSGWYSGDDHSHSFYYDGTHSPEQVMAAGMTAGLTWMCLSEHAHGPQLDRAVIANSESAAANIPGNFVVIPGLEFTTPDFHANLLGALLEFPKGATLQEVVNQVQTANTSTVPLTIKLNHPTLGGTDRDLPARTQGLPLLELWNSSEPAATNLWWNCLNAGQRVWADTASDSHHVENLEPGTRRTYVHLGQQELNAANIIRALRSGHSFLSHGGLIDFRISSAQPGDEISNGEQLHLLIQSWPKDSSNTIELIHSGKLIRRWNGATSARETITFEPGWYLVRLLPPSGELPLAMTNPIWIRERQKP